MEVLKLTTEGDWLKSDKKQLKELFEVNILPSYSTIPRSLSTIDEYSTKVDETYASYC